MGKNYLTVVYETDEKTSVQEILNAHPWALCSHTHAVYELAAARLEIAKLKTQLEAVTTGESLCSVTQQPSAAVKPQHRHCSLEN